ncbi:DUF3894 domain-containing protein [Bacillus sp. B-TM1]
MGAFQQKQYTSFVLTLPLSTISFLVTMILY